MDFVSQVRAVFHFVLRLFALGFVYKVLCKVIFSALIVILQTLRGWVEVAGCGIVFLFSAFFYIV